MADAITEEALQRVLSNATRCISVNRGETPERGCNCISARGMPGRLVERAESNPETENRHAPVCRSTREIPRGDPSDCHG